MYNYTMMILLYVVQFLVHATTDTRNSKFQMAINHVAFWSSLTLTVLVYGWPYIWIPPVILLLSALTSGVIGGLIGRKKDKKDSPDVFKSLSSPEDALLVADVKAEYLYLRERLQGYEYIVTNNATEKIQGVPYDVLTVQDVATGNLHDFYFDASHAMEHAEVNLNKMVEDRATKDKEAVIDWLKDNQYNDPEGIWDESFAKTTEAYDLIKEHDELTEKILQDKLGVSEEVAAAIIFRFKFRGWLR